jgi:hypothetical protein
MSSSSIDNPDSSSHQPTHLVEVPQERCQRAQTEDRHRLGACSRTPFDPRFVLYAMSEHVPTPPRTDCVARTLALIEEYVTPDALLRARLGGPDEDGAAADQPMTREGAAVRSGATPGYVAGRRKPLSSQS